MSSSSAAFVLGCDRSGTSLLRRILNAHSEIACPTETKFLFQFVKVFDTYQSITGLKNMGYGEEEVLEQMRVFTAYFLDGYAERHGKKRWVEKTTHNVTCVNTIDRIFAGTPLYIAIVRHGLDVAHSFTAVMHDKFTVLDQYRSDGADTALAGVRHWKRMNTEIIDFERRAGERLMWIRYEELTTEPEHVLRGMCEFLGVPWDEEILRYSEKEHDSGWEDPGAVEKPAIVPNSGKYKTWPIELQDNLYSEAQAIFEHFGYEL